jgi:hypothetical protein
MIPRLLILLLGFSFLMSADSTAQKQKIKANGTTLIIVDNDKRVDVFINGKQFTSYIYRSDIEKPILFPVYSPDGTMVTRGYPLIPVKGERVDHPHQIGLWFNHGNVNGIDFWNNSSSIPEVEKQKYGRIVHKRIISAESGKKGVLEVEMNWVDYQNTILLKEHTRYIFSGDAVSSTIDHLATLTAVNGPVTFGDSKEGMFAIRVARAFEIPSAEPLILTDETGKPSDVKVVDTTDVKGDFFASGKTTGEKVWGTRNVFVVLTATVKNNKISMGLFDQNYNPGFPAYAHTRGYGLFSLNNLGQNSYDPLQEKFEFKLAAGDSVTFIHRFYIQSGLEMPKENAMYVWQDFIKIYK